MQARLQKAGANHDYLSALVILLGVLLAVIAGGLGVRSPIYPAMILACVAGLAALRMQLLTIIVVVVVLTTSLYRGAWFAARVTFSGLEIGLFDALWLLILAKVTLVWLKNKEKPIAPPTSLFVACSISTVFVGLINAQPLYNILKFFRTEIFLAAGLSLGMMLPVAYRIRTLQAVAIGGAITAISQIITFMFATRGIQIWALLGIPLISDQPALMTVSTSVSSSYRDNGVTINFAVISGLIVLTSLLARSPLFIPRVAFAILTLDIAGITLSLTRTSWLAFAVGILVALLLLRNISAGQVVSWGFTGLMLACAFLVTIAIIPSGNAIKELVNSRVVSLNSGSGDLTIRSRLGESLAALDTVGGNWLIGVGAADISVDDQASGFVTSATNQLHNGYLQFFLAGGITSLLVLALVIGRSLKVGIRTIRREGGLDSGLIALSSTVAVSALLFTAIFGGVVNDSYQSGILGLLLGMMVFSDSKRYDQVHRATSTSGTY